MPWLYLLHFDSRRHHAEHYLGSTDNLTARLRAHATKIGARLTQVLRADNQGWRLAAAWQTKFRTARDLERRIKRQKNTPRYCPVCNPDPTAIPDALQIPLDDIALRLDLHDYEPSSEASTIIRQSTKDDINENIKQILVGLARREQDALGFVPVGGPEGITKALEIGHVLFATRDNDYEQEPIGYLLWHRKRLTTTIAQVCVDDRFRNMNIGRQLVEALAALTPNATLACNVKDTLPANDFWSRIGFARIRSFNHATSKNLLHHYERTARWPLTQSKTEKPRRSTTKEKGCSSQTSPRQSRGKSDTSTEKRSTAT